MQSTCDFKLNLTVNNGATTVHFFNDKMDICSMSEFLRYLKGVYSNKERFMSRFLSEKIQKFNKCIDELPDETPNKDFMKSKGSEYLNFLVNNFEDAIPFSYKEAFEIENTQFRALVFTSINIPEMMRNLNSVRIKTDGINVKHKKYDNSGKITHIEDYYNVYETHEIDGEQMGLTEKLYAIKCWCTSTNKEHWLWIDPTHKDDPLTAIAGTFHIHKNLIPYIKEIKRQGDVLLLELTENIRPEGDVVPLTKDEYFSKLTAQS